MKRHKITKPQLAAVARTMDGPFTCAEFKVALEKHGYHLTDREVQSQMQRIPRIKKIGMVEVEPGWHRTLYQYQGYSTYRATMYGSRSLEPLVDVED